METTLPEIKSGFEAAYAKNDSSLMKKLAEDHPEHIRSLVDLFLLDSSKAMLASRTIAAEKAYALAEAAAGIARDSLHDAFPSNQVVGYRSWTPGEHHLKVKADDFLKKAVDAFDEGRFGEVMLPGGAALEIYAQIKDVAGEGRALHYMGQARRRMAHYSEALALHQRALDLAKKIPDPLMQGQALIDMGDVFERKKELQTTIAFYRQATAVLKAPAFWQEIARAQRQLGDVYVDMGNYEEAYGAYRFALGHAERANDFTRIAECNDYIGFCHRRLGDYVTATTYHQRALENAERIASVDTRSRARARSFNHLGLCVSKLAEASVTQGDVQGAMEKFREAIAHEEAALGHASSANDRWRQGYVLRALSAMHRALGALLDDPEAKQEFNRSLRRADEALALGMDMGEREWQGLALHDRALALALLGRNPEGLATLERALVLWEQIGDLLSAGYAHRFVARQFHEASGRLEEAQTSYDRAIVAFEKIGDVESQAFTLMDKARVCSLLGKNERAADLYDTGIKKLESVRAKAGFPEFRKAFMGKVYDRYEEAALFAVGQGHHARALLYVESMKARTFLDQLAEGRVALEKGIDADLKAKRDDLENALDGEIEKITQAYQASTPDEKTLFAVRTRMAHLQVELDQIKKQIRMQNPLYASVQYPDPVTVPALQDHVLTDAEVLLEYFVTSRGVFCFMITTGECKALKLAADEKDIRNRVEALLENLQSGLIRGQGYDRFLAEELYDILIKPFDKTLSGKTLVVVPDGILALFPFEALVLTENGKRSYLFEKYAIKYVQSASVLALLRNHPNPVKPGNGFIGFGDPVYDYDSFKQGAPEEDAGLPGRGMANGISQTRYAELGGRLSRLTASGDEIRAIEGIFAKKGGGKALLREEAREEFAKKTGMDQYGYIHFSMHGIVTPGLQAIAFSQIPGAEEDGLLTMGEMMNLKYNAKLVVLSACRTGLGRMERGEGITGLTRSVLYAGSSAAVASLWSVDDHGTRELMTRFYQSMIQTGTDRSQALRQAKQEMIKTRYRHPYFWGAFIMYGE